MSLKNLALDVESIALALSEEGGYEYYHIDDDLKELAKNVSDMQAENAKLRELARDMWQFTGTACKKYPRLFDPATQGLQTVRPNMIDAFEQRMRELGVES